MLKFCGYFTLYSCKVKNNLLTAKSRKACRVGKFIYSFFNNMKKTFLFVFALICAVAFNAPEANAQSFEKGQVDVNLGVGLLPTFVGAGVKASMPPVSVSVDYGVSEKISIGGYIGYSNAKSEKYSYSTFGANFTPKTVDYQWKYSYIIVGVRGAYHFYQNDKIDAYGGALLGYNIASVNLETNDNSIENSIPKVNAGGVAWSAFLGARYRFSPKMGLFGELGYGISILNLGLNLKF